MSYILITANVWPEVGHSVFSSGTRCLQSIKPRSILLSLYFHVLAILRVFYFYEYCIPNALASTVIILQNKVWIILRYSYSDTPVSILLQKKYLYICIPISNAHLVWTTPKSKSPNSILLQKILVQSVNLSVTTLLKPTF